MVSKQSKKNNPRLDRFEVRRIRNNRYAITFSVELSGESLRQAIETTQAFEIWDRPKGQKRAPRKRKA